jgi:hypothetical protein
MPLGHGLRLLAATTSTTTITANKATKAEARCTESCLHPCGGCVCVGAKDSSQLGIDLAGTIHRDREW